MSEDQANSNNKGLERQLGLFDSTMIIMGIVIGSGIFLTTGIMAETLPSASMILLAWLVGGVLTLAGALTYAELGALMPEAGGQYVYLREAYGPLSGFLFGWITFAVYVTGAIAAMSVAFAEYFSVFFPAFSNENFLLTQDINAFGLEFTYTLSAGQVVASILIVVLSLVNYFGVLFGKIIQNFFTVLKIGTIIIFIIMGLAVSKNVSIDYTLIPDDFSLQQLITGFGISLIAVFWTFDAWNNITYVAGEIKDPGKTIPRALILGTAGVSLLYLLMNYVYLASLPMDEITGVLRIAERSTVALFGSGYSGVVSALVVVSIFAGVNGSILVGPRVYYAMAKDRLFFRKAAEVHPKFKTPGYAIMLQAVWAIILTISGTFEQLITFVMFVAIAFWIAAALSVFTLRKKYPDLHRPYKTWGYPVIPVLFILASLVILINTLLEKPAESIAGIIISLTGVPVYYYWKRKKNSVISS
ncbi:MAG: amino acid permease [bacterium]|nr:amino acid permease [bacterium]